jgi:hypothetical protein
MRTVASDIANMGLTIGDSVTLQLVDSVGNVCNAPVGGKIDETIVLESSELSFRLMENMLIPMATHYRLTVPDGIRFLFSVPKSHDNEETVHDLEALMRVGCLNGTIDADSGEIDESFLERFENYLLGNQADFSMAEMDVVGLYFYYADVVQGTGRTIDIIKKLDANLAAITE